MSVIFPCHSGPRPAGSYRSSQHVCALLLAVLFLFIVLPVPTAHAQDEDSPHLLTDADIQAEIATRIIDHDFLLRSLTQRDRIDYDPSGYALSGAEPGPLTLAGVHIHSVAVSPTRITLLGNRVALHYRGQGPDFQRIDLQNRPITITIHRDIPGDREFYTAALGRIFSTSREPDFQQRLPEWWHAYFSQDYRRELTGEYVDFTADAKFHHMDTESVKLRHPKLIRGNTDLFLSPKDKISSPGDVRLILIVNDNGVPQHVFIDRPLGFGLEEEAVKAARKLRFSPATVSGNPTDGEVYVNINFRRVDRDNSRLAPSMVSRLR